MHLRAKQELFAREYSEIFDFVYRYAASRLFQRDEADDVVSEVFLKAYAHLERFEPERGSLRQWMTGIVKNELLTHWRRQKPQVSLEDEERVADPRTGAAFTDELDHQLFAEKVYASLSAETKTLVTLRYIDGLTYEELAEVTGKEPAAMRQFFSRLHRLLRLEFQDLRD